jgi:hypothetical protein
MSGFVGYGLKGLAAGAKALKNVFKPTKVSPTIKSVTPKFPKNEIQAAVRDVQKTAFATRGSMKRQSQAFDRDLQKVKSSIGQSMQKLKGEPVTASGVSKGKDLVKKAKGGRVGLKLGTKKKSNIQKIQKTFGTNNKLGMQSVIYGLDKNPNITKADPKAKFIAAANKKKKKKVI